MPNNKNKTKKAHPENMGKCELCGIVIVSPSSCLKCGKIVCHRCAKFDKEDRYCPTCYKKIRTLYKLA
jgi:hypothetical protein